MYRISCIVKTSLPPLDVSHCSLGWLLSAVCRPALHTAGRKVWGGGGARSRGRCPMSVTSGTGHRLSGCDRAAERPAVSCGRCPMLVTSGTGRRPAGCDRRAAAPLQPAARCPPPPHVLFACWAASDGRWRAITAHTCHPRQARKSDHFYPGRRPNLFGLMYSPDVDSRQPAVWSLTALSDRGIPVPRFISRKF